MAFTDGGNRAEVAAAAFVIISTEPEELKKAGFTTLSYRILTEGAKAYEGKWTNNDMEMIAIATCLGAALVYGITDLVLHSDSQWSVYVIQGEYRLKATKFVELRQEIWRLGRQFESVEIKHVPRERNEYADWLCNKAMDEVDGRKKAKKGRPLVYRPRQPA
jgi:ribonuclease HI